MRTALQICIAKFCLRLHIATAHAVPPLEAVGYYHAVPAGTKRILAPASWNEINHPLILRRIPMF